MMSCCISYTRWQCCCKLLKQNLNTYNLSAISLRSCLWQSSGLSALYTWPWALSADISNYNLYIQALDQNTFPLSFQKPLTMCSTSYSVLQYLIFTYLFPSNIKTIMWQGVSTHRKQAKTWRKITVISRIWTLDTCFRVEATLQLG